jgi:hypothetical protein
LREVIEGIRSNVDDKGVCVVRKSEQHPMQGAPKRERDNQRYGEMHQCLQQHCRMNAGDEWEKRLRSGNDIHITNVVIRTITDIVLWLVAKVVTKLILLRQRTIRHVSRMAAPHRERRVKVLGCREIRIGPVSAHQRAIVKYEEGDNDTRREQQAV